MENGLGAFHSNQFGVGWDGNGHPLSMSRYKGVSCPVLVEVVLCEQAIN